MLAPVLARLDAIPGVTARVDSSGRFFWLAVDASADLPGATALAAETLGARASALSGADAEAQLAAHASGDPWLTAREVMMLSYVESRILSVRLASAVQHEVGATAEQREVIAEAVRSALFAAMERVHAEGGRSSSGWIFEEWPLIAAAAAKRCAARIPPPIQHRIDEILPGILTR